MKTIQLYNLVPWFIGIPLTLVIFMPSGVKAQVTRFPFEIKGKHIYIKVLANKTDTLGFVFDSGTTNAMIDSARAEQIGLVKDKNLLIQTDNGDSVKSTFIINPNLKVGDVQLKGLMLIMGDFFTLSRALNTHMDGIIGYEIMSRYVTKVDFDHKQISLYSRIEEVDTTGYKTIPFEFNKDVLIPRFPISITLANGETFTGRAMFDTGNAFSLLVSAPYSKFHNFNDKLGDSFPAWGLNPTSADQVAMIKSLSFNGFNFGSMSIRLTANDQAESKDGYLGILGIELIKRFNVIMDYANRKIYMKPNGQYHIPFENEKPTPESIELKKNMLMSKSFLTRNKTLPGIKVTSSGLQFKIIKEGNGNTPLVTDKVVLHYKLSLTDGQQLRKPFDAGNPWIHHLNKALEGIKEAVILMPVGSKWTLYMPDVLAYGQAGYQNVPPGAVVICELELIGIVNK